MLISIRTVVLMCLVFVGGDFRVIDKPVDTEVKVGESTYLNCSISDSTEVSWFHTPVGRVTGNHDYVYFNGQLLKPFDERFRIEKYMSGGSYHFNLILENAELSDAGQYVCQNGGTETPSPAELIVIEADSSCATNIDTAGLIGPNSCGLQRDVLRLSCGVGYKGNKAPSVQWTQISHENPFKVPEFTLPSSCKADWGRVVCNYTADSEIDMDGSRFICKNKRSKTDAHNCISGVVKIHYAFGEKMPRKAAVGDVVTCSPNASFSSLPCSYKWIWSDGNSAESVSQNEVLTVAKSGWHQCQANCYFDFQRRCNFDALMVMVSSPPEPSTSPIVPVIITAIATLGSCIVIGLIIVFLVTRKRKKANAKRKDVSEAGNSVDPENPSEPLMPRNPELVNDNAEVVRPRINYCDDENGMLKLLDGTIVDPGPIEEAARKELPKFIGHCMLVGHQRKFLAILLTFKTERDPLTSKPLNKLSPEAIEWVKSIGGNETTVSEITSKKCKPIRKAIRDSIDRINSNLRSQEHRIRKWVFLPEDFSIHGGELDATEKVNRSRVAEIYPNTIDSIFSRKAESVGQIIPIAPGEVICREKHSIHSMSSSLNMTI